MRALTRLSAGMLLSGLVAVATPAISEELPFPDVVVELGALGGERLRNGIPDLAVAAGQVRPGLSVDEVEELLGPPATASSHEDAQHWDYNISFPLADGRSDVICQFKVVASGGAVTSTHWRRHICEDLHQQLVSSAMAAPAPSPAPLADEVVTLSADVLFPFGEAILTPAGTERLGAVAEKLRAEYTDPAIILVGHTDRIGSQELNLGLSQRRAEAVRRRLSQLGIPASSMVAEGRGDREPLVQCQQLDPEALKACLQPNRRVEIEVFRRTPHPRAH